LIIFLNQATPKPPSSCADPSGISAAQLRFAIFVLLTNYLGFCKFSEVCEQVSRLEGCQCVEALKRNGFKGQESVDRG
jgi:hypothetical protein